MTKYTQIEAELQKLREAKEAIERQLAELEAMMDRTERTVAHKLASDLLSEHEL